MEVYNQPSRIVFWS